MAVSFCTKLNRNPKSFNSVASLNAFTLERVSRRLEVDLIEVKLAERKRIVSQQYVL